MPERIKAEVVIIGGGVIGTAIAYYLAKEGVDTVLVEKRGLLLGTSGACDGFCFIQTKKPGLMLKLALGSIRELNSLCRELRKPIHYRNTGGVILIENDKELKLMEEFVERQRKAGLNIEFINVEELSRICPFITKDIKGATFSPLDGQIHPIYFTESLLDGFLKLGGKVLLRSEVTKVLTTDSGKDVRGVVIDGNREVHADYVICAAGVESPVIGKMVGVNLPVTPLKGLLLVTEKLPPFTKTPIADAKYILAKLYPEILVDEMLRKLRAGLILEQTEAGNLLLGSTREPLAIAEVTLDGVKTITRMVLRYFPGLGRFNIIRAFAGLRPSTPDSYPIIGSSSKIMGFIVATGHEGDGIALAAITGRLVSEIITKGKATIDISELSPDRFQTK